MLFKGLRQPLQLMVIASQQNNERRVRTSRHRSFGWTASLSRRRTFTFVTVLLTALVGVGLQTVLWCGCSLIVARPWPPLWHGPSLGDEEFEDWIVWINTTWCSVRVDWNYYVHGTQTPTYIEGRKSAGALIERQEYRSPFYWSRRDVLRDLRKRGSPNIHFSEMAIGWPFPALRGSYILIDDDTDPPTITPLEGFVFQEPEKGTYFHKIVPLMPLWPGFIANSIVFLIPLVLMNYIIRFVTYWWRISDHRCPICGYLAFVANPHCTKCSECGELLMFHVEHEADAAS